MRGITITLYERNIVGTDALNHSIYIDVPYTVDNVLVAPVSTTEILETYNLTGRKAIYQLAIPKGDTHDWSAGNKVKFWDEYWRIIEIPREGIEHLIPLDWNKIVRVERYEQD